MDRARILWYAPWKKGLPKMQVTKPYSDWSADKRELIFMPRFITPPKAFKLKMRLLGMR